MPSEQEKNNYIFQSLISEQLCPWLIILSPQWTLNNRSERSHYVLRYLNSTSHLILKQRAVVFFSCGSSHVGSEYFSSSLSAIYLHDLIEWCNFREECEKLVLQDGLGCTSAGRSFSSCIQRLSLHEYCLEICLFFCAYRNKIKRRW